MNLFRGFVVTLTLPKLQVFKKDYPFQEGYTVYIVLGELPACTADQILSIERAFQAEPPRLIGEGPQSGRRGAGVSRYCLQSGDRRYFRVVSTLQRMASQVASSLFEVNKSIVKQEKQEIL